ILVVDALWGRGTLQELRRVSWVALWPLAWITSDFLLQFYDIEEDVGLPAEFVRYHRRLSLHRGYDRDPHALALHGLNQRPKVAITRKQNHVVDIGGELHCVNRKL